MLESCSRQRDCAASHLDLKQLKPPRYEQCSNCEWNGPHNHACSELMQKRVFTITWFHSSWPLQSVGPVVQPAAGAHAEFVVHAAAPTHTFKPTKTTGRNQYSTSHEVQLPSVLSLESSPKDVFVVSSVASRSSPCNAATLRSLAVCPDGHTAT